VLRRLCKRSMGLSRWIWWSYRSAISTDRFEVVGCIRTGTEHMSDVCMGKPELKV